MAYLDMFQRYGCESTTAEINLRGYFTRPDKVRDGKSLVWEDQHAAGLIEAAQTLIENLTEYRQALAARYAELEIMPYKLILKIKRQRGTGGVNFYITISKVYEDGTEVTEMNEHYTGKERHKALARFEALKKQRPGIEAVKDIEKGRWEH